MTTQYDHVAQERNGKDAQEKKSPTNLELPEESRAVTAASATLSRPQTRTLWLLSLHSNLAGGGSNLKDRVKEFI